MGKLLWGVLLLCSALAFGDDKPRVFITDSQSWEVSGHAGGSEGAFGAETHGGARPQTAEIIKTFGKRCPQVTVNNIPSKADYIVLLDHEGGKSLLQHKNKVAVFTRVTGDSIVSHSTLSLGGSVQEACEAINKHWAENGPALRAEEAKEDVKPSPAQTPEAPKPQSSPKLSISSIPDGADIEVDGSFMGNTPSAIELTPGEHTVSVTKLGYKPWERKIKLTGGDIKLNAELEKAEESPKAQ